METRPTTAAGQTEAAQVKKRGMAMKAIFFMQRAIQRLRRGEVRQNKRDLGKWVPRFLRSKYDPRNGTFYRIRNAASAAEARRIAGSVHPDASNRTQRKALRLAAAWPK